MYTHTHITHHRGSQWQFPTAVQRHVPKARLVLIMTLEHFRPFNIFIYIEREMCIYIYIYTYTHTYTYTYTYVITMKILAK